MSGAQAAVGIGAGESTGGAIAKRFARAGCDARDEDAVVSLFDAFELDLRPYDERG